jgi:8-oxo-dGTP pyrophosphatase MutT (NUDIX family)
MTDIRRKAFAYITREGTATAGTELLIFAHADFPEAGLQVPAGTMEPDERPEDAVMREAQEETGLAGLALVGPIGRATYDLRPYGWDEGHDRWFFHLRCDERTPDRWQAIEEHAADGSGPLRFDCFWVPLDRVPPLIADHDCLIDALIASLA